MLALVSNERRLTHIIENISYTTSISTVGIETTNLQMTENLPPTEENENLKDLFSTKWSEDQQEDSRRANTPTSLASPDDSQPRYPDNVNAGLNDRLIHKINELQNNLLLCTSDYYKWTSLYMKDGVEASRRIDPGSKSENKMCVRGQTFLPYTIKEIFEVLSDIRYRKIIEPTVDDCCPIKPLSNHSGIEYLKFKGIWPTAPRDFCNLLHWRLLNNGIFLYFAFDEPSNHFPERTGVVRGHLQLGGYVMKQVRGGTMISLVVQVVKFQIGY